MQKINTADGLFVDGNQSTGVPGTILTAAWLNMVQAELISVLTAAGISVDGAKSDQLATAIQTLQRGKATVNVAGGVAVTLTAAQYGLPILILTGALTANINVIFPASSGAWIVRNQTTGAYTVTCKTAAGSGVVVSQGFNNALWGDGTNIYTEQSDWLSIALTGTPTAPTAAAGTNTTQVANMAAVQTAVNGKLTKSVAGGATVTLTATEAGYAMLELTGALTASINVVVPTASGQWIVKNATSGAYTLTVKTAAGTGVTVPKGLAESLWCDGTNVLEADGGKADKATTLAGYGITDGMSALPAGLPLDWIGLAPPSWAVVRDGSALTRASYTALYAALCPTRSGTLVNGANTVTGLSSTLDLWVGMPVEGVGVPAGTTVASIASANAITLSANATASGAQTLTLFLFGYGNAGSATTFGVPDDRGLHTRAYDSGRGYEQSTLTANTTNASNVLSGITSTRGLYVGMPVSGTGIPANTTIASITGTTGATMSANATATGTGVALTVIGRQIGAEGTDEVRGHAHTAMVQLAGTSHTVSNVGDAPYFTKPGATSIAGGPENSVKRRIYLPIITLGA